MSILRTLSNLHRGLRLLKKIAATQDWDDVTKVVQDTAAHTANLESRLKENYQQGRNDLQKTEKKIMSRLGKLHQVFGDAQKSMETSCTRYLSDVRDQTDGLAQRMEASQQTAVNQINKASQSINELSNEISSLREYTAKQQEQIRRFREGYDWTVLKNFVMRIMRSIDGVEERIASMNENSDERKNLEFIRDDLVFALEGSGFERFEPEIKSEYKGQEKTVKVASTELAPSHEDVGRIASVVKAGYLYETGQDETVLVRSAEVILYAERNEDKQD